MSVAQADPAESGAVSLDLTVAAPGNYQCNAHADNLDAQMAIAQGGSDLATDSDSGEGVDAQITRELAPGTYQVRVWEWQGRAASISVTCIPAPAVPAAPAAVTIGTPATVPIAANLAEAARPELALTIATPGFYQCDAQAAGADAQLAIVQNGQVLEQNDDGGDGFNARITRVLSPGTYQLRVWEYRNAATTITLGCSPATAAPGQPGGALEVGTPVTVAIPAGEGAAGQVSLNLAVSRDGTYQCDAISSDLDAQLAILQGEQVLEQNDDGGDGVNARITRALTAGAYTVRVHEWQGRATQITVGCNRNGT